MNNSVLIHQPMFAPWPNFFLNLKKVNKLILLDNVIHSKSDLINRNYFHIANKKKICTIPLRKSSREKVISKVEIDYTNTNKFINQITTEYKNHIFFGDMIYLLESLFNKKYIYLADLNKDILEKTINYLNIDIEILCASNLVECNKEWIALSPTEKNLYLTLASNSNTYLSGISGKDYLEKELFTEKNIRLEFTENVDNRELSILHYISEGGINAL